MTPNMAKAESVGWLLPRDVVEPPSLKLRDKRNRKTELIINTRKIRAADGDNSDILMPVQKRRAILDSFYDD